MLWCYKLKSHKWTKVHVDFLLYLFYLIDYVFSYLLAYPVIFWYILIYGVIGTEATRPLISSSMFLYSCQSHKRIFMGSSPWETGDIPGSKSHKCCLPRLWFPGVSHNSSLLTFSLQKLTTIAICRFLALIAPMASGAGKPTLAMILNLYSLFRFQGSGFPCNLIYLTIQEKFIFILFSCCCCCYRDTSDNF